MVNKNGILIANDTGHGSDTPGKRTPDGYREHYANVKVGMFFDEAAHRCGFDTIRIGWDDAIATDDPDTALRTRQRQIKESGADASVSNHMNAFGDGKTFNNAQGNETLIHSNPNYRGDSRALAEAIQKHLSQGTPQKNRGVKTMDLAMCNCKVMGTKASILVENGFMTNEFEAKLMKSDAFCKECAEEEVMGFCDYYNVPYVKPGQAVKPSTPPKPTAPAGKDELEVDGKWGPDCTRKSQKVYDTTVDGVISNQPLHNVIYLHSCFTASWEFEESGYEKGSSLIKAIQRDLKAKGYYKGNIDGWCGKNTVIAMQKFLANKGFYKGRVDGSMGPATVKAWQQYINSRL